MEDQAQNVPNINEQNDMGHNGSCACGTASDAGNDPCAGTNAGCVWLRKLRAPGMALSYSLEKRHIPDMDAQKGSRAGGQKASQAASQGGQSGQSGAKNGGQLNGHPTAGGGTGAYDTMQASGACAVRYFDLAVGAAALLVLCGMVKCVCGCCRCMKYKMF